MNNAFSSDARDLFKSRNIIVSALNNGGATVKHDYTGLSLTDKTGYIVGGYAPSVSYNVPLVDVWDVAITSGDVAITTRRYVAAFRVDAFAYALHKYIVSSPRHDAVEYVGLWYENDCITFDVVRIIPTLGDAVDAARLYGEAAIYDIHNAQDITV